MQGMVEGKLKQGRPPRGWMDDIKEVTGLSATGATRLAADCRKWNTLVIIATPAHVHYFRERQRENLKKKKKKKKIATVNFHFFGSVGKGQHKLCWPNYSVSKCNHINCLWYK